MTKAKVKVVVTPTDLIVTVYLYNDGITDVQINTVSSLYCIKTHLTPTAS